jgi:hypothetical protein
MSLIDELLPMYYDIASLMEIPVPVKKTRSRKYVHAPVISPAVLPFSLRATSVRSERVLITPEIAAYLLTQVHPLQRKIKPRHVDQMARDMKRGSFVENGDAVRFDIEGQLIDGQHRLMALIEADLPLWTQVVLGLPLGALPTIDSGTKRGLSDRLAVVGIFDPHVVFSGFV